MSQEQIRKKKPVLLIVAALVVLVVGGVLLYGNSLKNQKIKEMQDALAQVPAPYTLTVGDIDASFWGRSLTLTDIKIALPYKDVVFEIGIDKIEGEGVHPSALQTPGVAKLADTLAVTNVVTTGKGFTSSTGFYELRDINGDFMAIAREWGLALPALQAMQQEMLAITEGSLSAGRRAADGNDVEDGTDEDDGEYYGGYDEDDVNERLGELVREHMPSLLGLVRSAETLRVGRLVSRDHKIAMEVEGETIAVRCAGTEASDYSLGSYGPMKLKEMTVAHGDKDVATFGEMGVDGGTLPSYADLLEMLAKGDESIEQIQDFFRNSAFSFKNFYARDIKVTAPDGVVTAKAFAMDMDYNKGDFSTTFTLDELAGNKNIFPARSADARAILAVLPENLVLSSRNGINIKAKGSLYDVAFAPLSVTLRDFGMVELSADVRDVTDDFGDAEPLLASMDLTVADNGASGALFTWLAQEEGSTAENVREQVIFQLKMSEDMLQGPLKDMNTVVQQFLQNPGGTLAIGIRPETPNGLEDLELRIMTEPDTLGISSSFTPAPAP